MARCTYHFFLFSLVSFSSISALSSSGWGHSSGPTEYAATGRGKLFRTCSMSIVPRRRQAARRAQTGGGGRWGRKHTLACPGYYPPMCNISPSSYIVLLCTASLSVMAQPRRRGTRGGERVEDGQEEAVRSSFSFWLFFSSFGFFKGEIIMDGTSVPSRQSRWWTSAEANGPRIGEYLQLVSWLMVDCQCQGV